MTSKTFTSPSIDIEQNSIKKKHTCPKCKVELNLRVRRGVLIKALFPNTLKRYLCSRCMHKYYVIA